MFTYALLRNANKTLWDNSASKFDKSCRETFHGTCYGTKWHGGETGGKMAKDYSYQQAADAAGVSKSKIARQVKSGVLSKNDAGRIDPSELARVYPDSIKGDTAGTTRDTVQERSMARSDTAPDTGEARVLSVQVEQMQAQLDLLLSERNDLRSRLDRSEEMRALADEKRDEAQTKLTALLTDQRTDKEPEQPKRRRWWQVAVFL